MSTKTIRSLCVEADREALRPIVEALAARGVKILDLTGKPSKSELVLAALSAAFYADEAAVEKLLGLLGAGAENVLPLQLDETPVPDRIKNVLYSRNIIPTAGREDAHTAERILAALPRKKNPLPLLLTAGALVLAAIAGVLIWRASQNKETVPAMAREQLEVAVAYGLTEEELAEIEDVVIVGDRAVFLKGEELDAAIGAVHDMVGDGSAPFIYFDVDNYAVLDENDPGGGIHWYDMKTGQELGAARHEDLRFLSLMPNLRYLSLALVDVPAEGLPDLSGAEKLEGVAVLSSSVDTLSWLSGSSVRDMMIRFSPIRGFGALTGCENLRLLHVDMRGTDEAADFSGFAPPKLENASLWFVDFSASQDLSELSSLPALRELQLLQPTGLRTLDGLNAPALEELEITDGYELEDVSALSGLRQLKSLMLDDCPPLQDYSPIAGCTALESVMIYAGWDVRLRDASFLGELPELRDIRLYSIDLPDIDFLRGIGQRRDSLERFDFSGGVRDFSALSAVAHYDMLGIDLYGGSIDRVIPDLQDTGISYLYLRRVSGLELSALPKVEDRLLVYECELRDLSDLPADWPTRRIQLYNCGALRSLDGLQELAGFREDGRGVLEVTHCPELTDWSALDGLELDTLLVSSCYTLPSFKALGVKNLHLESIPDLTDLALLDEMEPTQLGNVELIGLDGVKSLEPLRRFRGETLTVSPQLEEQAADLVRDGLFTDYRVEYPRGGWNMDDDEYALQELGELDTLPPALLRHVRTLCLAGDRLVDPERFDSVGPGEYGDGAVKEIGMLSGLSGLRYLALKAQPLTDLNGIQSLTELETFRAEDCGRLRDVSALFALQGLQEIGLRGTAVDSLQGVQNLYELRRIDVSHTAVTDLTALLGLEKLESVTVSADMTEAINGLNGQTCGFELSIIG